MSEIMEMCFRLFKKHHASNIRLEGLPKCCVWCMSLLPDRIDATAAMINDKITPGPAISLATSPATTYMPVPTQLPTPRDTRSTVVRTCASLVVPCRSTEPSCMECSGLVLSTREWRPYHDASHSIRRGSSLVKTELIILIQRHGTSVSSSL